MKNDIKKRILETTEVFKKHVLKSIGMPFINMFELDDDIILDDLSTVALNYNIQNRETGKRYGKALLIIRKITAETHFLAVKDYNSMDINQIYLATAAISKEIVHNILKLFAFELQRMIYDESAVLDEESIKNKIELLYI